MPRADGPRLVTEHVLPLSGAMAGSCLRVLRLAEAVEILHWSDGSVDAYWKEAEISGEAHSEKEAAQRLREAVEEVCRRVLARLAEGKSPGLSEERWALLQTTLDMSALQKAASP